MPIAFRRTSLSLAIAAVLIGLPSLQNVPGQRPIGDEALQRVRGINFPRNAWTVEFQCATQTFPNVVDCNLQQNNGAPCQFCKAPLNQAGLLFANNNPLAGVFNLQRLFAAVSCNLMPQIVGNCQQGLCQGVFPNANCLGGVIQGQPVE